MNLDLKPANLSAYEPALKAGREYVAAKTPEEQKQAAEKLHAACSTLPGAKYPTREEFEKDFFSEVPIEL